MVDTFIIQVLLVVFVGFFEGVVGCENHEFECHNGQCISKFAWCNTVIDCRDESDEKFCIKESVSGNDPNNCRGNVNLFLCDCGMCIPKSGVCDGLKTCEDGSDEANCKTLYNAVREVRSPGKKRPVSRLRVDDPTYYSDLPYESYQEQVKLARDWLLSQQKDDYGWGDYTARAMIAMYSSKLDNSPKTERELLMDKQLDIELSIALTRNQTKEMTLSELALNINALVASCANPRDFYGYDLIKTLRERANFAYDSGSYVNPYVYLTLCLNNATQFDDIKVMQDLNPSRKPNLHKFDTLSLIVLATVCMIRVPQFRHTQLLTNKVSDLLNEMEYVGLPQNVYELALITQALNEAKVDPNTWKRNDAMDFILSKQKRNGSFGDILATYYAMPLLSGKSIFLLSEHCKKDFSNGFIPLAVLKNASNRKINVVYTLRFGYPGEMSQKIQLKVPEGTNLLDVMRLAQEENQSFRFNLEDSKPVSFVYSIGGIPNDPERGIYWTLYASSPNSSRFSRLTGDIRTYVPYHGQEIRFCQTDGNELAC